MRIFFDYQAFERQCFGGISRSYAELIVHLQNVGVEECILGLKESDNIYIQNKNIKPLYYTRDFLFGRKKRFIGQHTINKILLQLLGYPNEGTTINQDHCIKLLKEQEFDIFEPTYFDPYFIPYLNGKPFVMTVHDMIPELFPQYFARDDFQIINKKLLCPLASAIHVPSIRTKDDLVNILNIDPNKIIVIHHGTSVIKKPEIEQPSPIDKPYILFVGARWEYKNFEPLLREMAILVQTVPELNLLCTEKPFNSNEKRIISDLQLSDKVHHIFATDENFYSLYHNALAFVYSSTYEGFGLPILEAWSCGCPVLLNNASCFPEIGGDAAIFFDINKKGDLAEHLKALYNSSNEDRQQIINNGKKRAKLFSWEESAKKLKQVYESII